MAEMLAVVAAPAAEDWPLVRGSFELRVPENRGDGRAVLVFESPRIRRDPARNQPFEQFIDLEQFRHETPAPIESIAHPLRALGGAVPQPHRPFGRELAVISDFLDRFG